MGADSDHGSAAKGSTIDLEVTGTFFLSLLFPYHVYISLACLSFTLPWYADYLQHHLVFYVNYGEPTGHLKQKVNIAGINCSRCHICLHIFVQ